MSKKTKKGNRGSVGAPVFTSERPKILAFIKDHGGFPTIAAYGRELCDRFVKDAEFRETVLATCEENPWSGEAPGEGEPEWSIAWSGDPGYINAANSLAESIRPNSSIRFAFSTIVRMWVRVQVFGDEAAWRACALRNRQAAPTPSIEVERIGPATESAESGRDALSDAIASRLAKIEETLPDRVAARVLEMLNEATEPVGGI